MTGETQRSDRLPLIVGEIARDEGRVLSLDAWLFLREGGRSVAPGLPLAASYGRSQAGAVLRYRLDPGSGRDPAIHARVNRALSADETDAALGVSARPVAAIPVRLHAEMRLTRQSGQSEVRPSAFVTAGFSEHDLPLGVEARGYLQAGYVGGDFATGFVDGQLVADRRVLKLSDETAVSIGGGVWGGAQEGAERLDAGPSARIDWTLAGAPVRLAADYRFRVAGDARPASGGALTLSTAF